MAPSVPITARYHLFAFEVFHLYVYGAMMKNTFMLNMLTKNASPSLYSYTQAEFLFVRSWCPCIFFSGGVTVGNIGRQLAAVSIVYLQFFSKILVLYND